MTQTLDPKSTRAWINAIAQAIDACGADSASLLTQAGIPLQTRTDDDLRVETEKVTELFRLAVVTTGNPAFGLKVVRHIMPATFHALGYSLFASATLLEFCQRLVRFFKLLSDDGIHHLEETGEGFVLSLELTNSIVCEEAADGWIGCVVHFCRIISGHGFAPLRIELLRDAPASHIEDYDRFFKAPVIFSAGRIAIVFDKKDMRVPLSTGDPELARRNDEVVIELLARLDRSDVVRQVEASIIDLLPTGECSKNAVASRLNMSPRSLQNKLDQKSTSYQEVLDTLRSGLARQYIEQKSMSISEITYLLGFSDTSNFSRAFKRWTGLSPSCYRDK